MKPIQSERAESIDDAELAPIGGDQISQMVARVWQQVLLVPVRAAEDDFFDSGGDSLKAITFVIELERALGLEISLTLHRDRLRVCCDARAGAWRAAICSKRATRV